MTLGTRIQELRKQQGLSQEALGEALGVSRQAISKWESDVTVPEVDKLIALSKRFGVPVGVLLGVEAAQGGAPGEAAPELTGRELRAVEAIVSRYVAETEARRRTQAAPQPPPARRKRRWPAVLAAAAAVCLVWSLLARVKQLNDQVSTLQSQVDRIDTSVSSQISSISSRVEHILKAQNDLVADSSCTLADIDLAGTGAGTALFQVSATPKRYTEGLSAEFSASGHDFETVTVQGTPGKDLRFQADLTCPLSDDITISVTFTSGGVRETQQLHTEGGLASNTQPSISSAHVLFGDEVTGGSYHLSDTIHLRWTNPLVKTAQGTHTVSVRALSLQVYVGGAKAAEVEGDGSGVVSSDILQVLHIPVDVTLSLAPGDTLTLLAKITDSHGRTYRQILNHYAVEPYQAGAQAVRYELTPADWPALSALPQ